MNALSIANTTVRQFDGLYSLNDLHNAAGGEGKHKPANFMRLDQTRELVAEIQVSDVSLAEKTIHGGQMRGTYVCKELVYSYAMWISAKFHLAVIRAFDALQTGAVSPAPTFQVRPALSDAIAIYRESMNALLLAHTKKQAHLLACVSATRVTGVDLESMWAPALAKPVVGRSSQTTLLPWHKPEASGKNPLDKLARYLRNAKHLPVSKQASRFTAELIASLLQQGRVPRQILLKVMHVPASEFNLLIAEAKEAGIVRELDGIEFNYAGTLYTAGGAA